MESEPDKETAVELAKAMSIFFMEKKTLPADAINAMVLQIYALACIAGKNPKQVILSVTEDLLNLSQVAEKINSEDFDDLDLMKS